MTGAAQAVAQEKRKLQILMAEDNASDGELVIRALRKSGFEVSAKVVQTREDFRRQVKESVPDVVLADYNLGSWRGMEALEILREEGRDIPLILVSGALGDVTAVECIKQGATDYVLKDSLARLPEAVRRALRERDLKKERMQVAEDLARKVEELARSNHDLEQFAYVASHDLQEPLRMVANYTQLLSERYRGKLDEQADKYIFYAVDGATRMQTQIQDLLAFSRVGREGMACAATDCNAVVEGALRNLQAPVQESGAQIVHGELPIVMGNASQLQQVFQNLIGNALKFRGPETPVIRISAESKVGEWVFAVTDNGIGIAPEYLETIFTVFKRLHTRVEYPGNGIGLSICKKIVERHGGRIWVTSEPGHGATFGFTLPAKPIPGDGEQQVEPQMEIYASPSLVN
jgi:signal transduction histidine kinase